MAHNLTEADCEVDASEKKKKKKSVARWNRLKVRTDNNPSATSLWAVALAAVPAVARTRRETRRKKQNTLSVFPRHRGGKRTDSVPFTRRVVAAAAASDAVRPRKEQTLCFLLGFFQLAREP